MKTPALLLVLMATAVVSTQNARAWDQYDEEALTNTQNLLRDRKQREAEAAKSMGAGAANQQAVDVMGAAGTDGLYGLAADIFETIAKEANGDPQKMSEVLTRAMKNPESFAAKLTPSQLARLKQLAAQAEAAKSVAKPK